MIKNVMDVELIPLGLE